MDRAEKDLTQLTAKRTALEARLNDPALYNGNQDAVAELQIELGDVTRRIAAAEQAWLENQQALEQAQDADAA